MRKIPYWCTDFEFLQITFKYITPNIHNCTQKYCLSDFLIKCKCEVNVQNLIQTKNDSSPVYNLIISSNLVKSDCIIEKICIMKNRKK